MKWHSLPSVYCHSPKSFFFFAIKSTIVANIWSKKEEEKINLIVHDKWFYNVVRQSEMWPCHRDSGEDSSVRVALEYSAYLTNKLVTNTLTPAHLQALQAPTTLKCLLLLSIEHAVSSLTPVKCNKVQGGWGTDFIKDIITHEPYRVAYLAFDGHILCTYKLLHTKKLILIENN